MKTTGFSLVKLLVTLPLACLLACSKPAAGPPVAVSINPSEGSGAKMDFTATFSDPKGASNLTVIGVLINDQLDGGHGCYVMSLAPFTNLNLVKDSGVGSEALFLDEHSKVENSQCSLSARGSAINMQGKEIVVKASVEFKAEFQGNKDVFMWARNAQGDVAPQKPSKGAWVVP